METQNASLIPDIHQIFQLAFLPNDSLVRERGIEPPRPCGHQPLMLACIPFHHSRKLAVRLGKNTIIGSLSQDEMPPTGKQCPAKPLAARVARHLGHNRHSAVRTANHPKLAAFYAPADNHSKSAAGPAPPGLP